MSSFTTPAPSERRGAKRRRGARRDGRIIGLDRWTKDSRSRCDLGAIAQAVETPALVLDLGTVQTAMQAVDRVREATGCGILYALKPLAHPGVLRTMAGHVNGFAASSLFEAQLARKVVGAAGSVHVTSPGLRLQEIDAISRLCDHVVFNSLEQQRLLGTSLSTSASVSQGIRVNPGLPLVEDDRYNPCRPFSKLGVPIGQLARAIERRGGLPGVSGLHFHTSCEGQSYQPLLQTVEHVMDRLDALLAKLAWINLGGGYLLEPPDGLAPLTEAVKRLKTSYGVTVLIEPGAALVRTAGFLVATVIDLFRHGGKRVAVLDTTVNHMPEVFEYQFEPDILGDHADGEYEFLLVGGTCLAGDLFGEYGFDEPLRVGDRIVFPDTGAYTLVKAHMFNGINLPAVYLVSMDGKLGPGHQLEYQDYLRHCGVASDAAV